MKYCIEILGCTKVCPCLEVDCERECSLCPDNGCEKFPENEGGEEDGGNERKANKPLENMRN